MKNLIVAILLLVGLNWTNSAGAKPQGTRYTLHIAETKDEYNKLVSLRDNQLQRTLWTRKLYDPKAIWSQDKRAVVVENAGSFLVWREGHALRNFAIVKGFDYTMGYVWSPDNQRLLIRFGLSAMSDVGPTGVGRLFCLKLGGGNFYQYSHIAGGVSRMKWHDNKTVLYRVFDTDDNGKEIVTPLRKWSVR